MKGSLISGAMAGLVGGLIVAIAIVATRPSTTGAGLAVNDLRPIRVEVVTMPAADFVAPDGSERKPFYVQAADGGAELGSSAQNPVYIRPADAGSTGATHVVVDGPVYTWSCDAGFSFSNC